MSIRVQDRLGASSTQKPRFTWKAIPAALLFGVVLPVGVIVIGGEVDRALNLPLFPPKPINLALGAVGLLLGYVFALGSIYQLYMAGSGLPWGDVDPDAQSTKLVTGGLYSYTRNPMIFGTLCIAMGLGCVVQSVTAAVLFPIVFLVVLYSWVKSREEPALVERFGEEYVEYRRTTPFLFPRPWRPATKKGP